jgi:beta-lactamase superfamily II metal-dependent hydrolase
VLHLEKAVAGSGRSPYQWQHEPVLFGWKKKGKHNWYTDRKQTTIWEFEKPKKNADHPP